MRNSASAIEFLTSFGVDLSELSKCGGHSYPRTHRAKPPPPDQLARNIGFEITSKLIDHVNNLAKETTSRGSIRVINSAKATKLLTCGGDVVGVESESAEGKTELRSDVVILTTGGLTHAQNYTLNLMVFRVCSRSHRIVGKVCTALS